MTDKKEAQCQECLNSINLIKDKYVLLGTYDKSKSLNESYYHFNCFSVWHNRKVNEKARNVIGGMQEKAQGLLGNMKGLVGNFQGMDQLGSMLGIDLNKEVPNFTQEKEEKKENGNKRGSSKKSK